MEGLLPIVGALMEDINDSPQLGLESYPGLRHTIMRDLILNVALGLLLIRI